MKKVKILASISMVTAAALALVACGNNNAKNSNNNLTPNKFKDATPAKTAQKGGNFNLRYRNGYAIYWDL